MFSQHFASFKEGRQGFFNSSLFVLRQPCLGKIIFLFKEFVYILAVCVLLCWYEMDIDFLFYSYCVMVVFLLIFFLVRFLFIFRCTFRRCLVCICPFITLISCSVYFGSGFVGTFLAGRVVFSFCVRLRYVECRAGTIYLSVGLEWVAGLYGFSFLGLC
jgi:hypothetical protein